MRERGIAKQGARRKTQFILNNWLHLSKHCRTLAVVFSNQFYTKVGEKISLPSFSFLQKETKKNKIKSWAFTEVMKLSRNDFFIFDL